MAAAGPRLPFAWQAQYTEPPHFPFVKLNKFTLTCRVWTSTVLSDLFLLGLVLKHRGQKQPCALRTYAGHKRQGFHSTYDSPTSFEPSRLFRSYTSEKPNLIEGNTYIVHITIPGLYSTIICIHRWIRAVAKIKMQTNMQL